LTFKTIELGNKLKKSPKIGYSSADITDVITDPTFVKITPVIFGINLFAPVSPNSVSGTSSFCWSINQLAIGGFSTWLM
jgi:hypothetical protein